MIRQMSVMQHSFDFNVDEVLKNLYKINEEETNQCKRKNKNKRT
jgi:hypothetical protein